MSIKRKDTSKEIRIGSKQSGKTAQQKKQIAQVPKNKKVSVMNTKKNTPHKAGTNKARVPYSNQYGSFDGITFKKAKGT
jgi:hypothetical protein